MTETNDDQKPADKLQALVTVDTSICSICGKEIGRLFVGNGSGVAHLWCYEIEHPPAPVQTIYEVARGCGDPVLAATVISEMVPEEMAQNIVDEFNERLKSTWLRRCSP